MICPDCVIVGEVDVHADVVLHPKVTATALEGFSCKIGAKTVIEETSSITNSSIGDECLVEVGSQIYSSSIGNTTYIGPKCRITNCTIGSGCVVCPAIVLDNVVLPDNTNVFCVNGKWQCKPVDNSFMKSTLEHYREKLLVAMQVLSKSTTSI